jgi:hypothetical protein
MALRVLTLLLAAASFSLTACGVPSTPNSSNVFSSSGKLEKDVATKYIYVTDAYLNEVLVYPASVPNASPIKTVTTPSRPWGAATDSEGNVYIAVSGIGSSFLGEILVFSSGLASQLYTITNGINYPTAITVDDQNNLYVAQHTVVLEYAAGAESPSRTISGLKWPIYGGLAVDPYGTVYASFEGSLKEGGVEEYANGVWNVIQTITQGAADGIAWSNQQLVAAVAAHYIAYYAYPGFNLVKQVEDAPPPAAIQLFAVGGDGTLYLPVTTGSEGTSKGYVIVVPASANNPYTITNGLEYPWGTASGD